MDALHYLYVHHVDHVHGVIQRVVRDHHAAEDIAQAVFTKLVHVIARYEERDVPFAAWISRVARNAALDYVRARRQVPVDEIRVADSTAGPIAAERSRTLREALLRLPEEQRRVVMMRHVAGMTPSEIAKQLGRSEPSIHGLHHRGRASLKEILVELDSAPKIAA
jgi:RNA polymerase sigma-70 factor (ECF subfamily)